MTDAPNLALRAPKSDFLAEVSARGFVQDVTDFEGLDRLLEAPGARAYIGFDATASSLHIGSLVPIMLLRWLQKTGHKPVALMGGGTTKIGDPSGRDTSRKLLDEAGIAANVAGIRAVVEKYVAFGDGETDALLANNAEWLDDLNYISFLRDVGSHFTINKMLTLESVRSRIDREQSLSFIEFNYVLLQSYDFVELNKRYGVRLQLGGSDQWGNIVNGIELGRRMAGADLFGLTAPLMTTADGKKMGKSADGAVWLSAANLSAYAFWQYWRNVADADVGRFLKLFTELSVAECERLGALGGAEINEAKIRLANEATTLCHGAEAAAAAEATARETFEAGGAGADLPRVTLTDADFAEGSIAAAQLFVKAGLAKSGKDAKRLIAEGGARIDGEIVSDPTQPIQAEQFEAADVKLSAGKKRHALAGM